MFGKKPTLVEAQAAMVEKQLAARGITDPRILKAMGEIPRQAFVTEALWGKAYHDGPLPIGHGQTISQPYIVALMTQSLKLPPDGQAVVLEIGTGSGYQAAILSRLAAKVYSVERIESLAEQAHQTLTSLGIDNVAIRVGDGGYGWPEYAPYDGIIATAAAPAIPPPLVDQLKDGALLVAPVGPRWEQELLLLSRQGNEIQTTRLAPVAFVPLLGEHGWAGHEYW